MPVLLAFIKCACITSIILSLGEIMSFYSYCAEKGLVYIMIASPTGRQFLSCAECTKANMHSLCDVRSAFDAKYTLLINLCNLLVLYLIYCKVSRSNGC